jgi:hypothetical protein
MDSKTGFFATVFGLIKESVYDKQKGGKVSSGRLSSYFVLAAILSAAFTFIGIDIANAIIAMCNKGFYEIPANHIVLYGMTLAHHLALLGINKNAETKIEKAVQERMKSLEELKSKSSESSEGDEAKEEGVA